MKITLEELAHMIDHTNLKPDASSKDIEQLCNEAKEYNFKMVAINQVQTKLCSELLEGSGVGVGAAISFPLGQTTIESKVFDTTDAIEKGATEIDYVINITELKNGNLDYIREEMSKIVSICKRSNVISKVIFENCYLTNEEIISVANIAKDVQPDFIKTSTGFGTSGAKIEDIKLMKKIVGKDVKVKAAGGIRDAKTFVDFIKNGAERIGSSSGIAIINEISAEMKKKGVNYIEV